MMIFLWKSGERYHCYGVEEFILLKDGNSFFIKIIYSLLTLTGRTSL